MTGTLKSWPQPKILSLNYQGLKLDGAIKKNKSVSAGQLLAHRQTLGGYNLHAPFAGLIVEVNSVEIIINVGTFALERTFVPLDLKEQQGADLALSLQNLGVPLPDLNPLEPLIINALDEEPGINYGNLLFHEYYETMTAALAALEKIWPEREIIFVGPPGFKLWPQYQTISTANKYPNGLPGLVKKLALSYFDPLGHGVLNGRDLFFIGRAQLTGWPIWQMPLSLQGINYLVPIGSRIIDLLEFANLYPQRGQTVVLGGFLRGHSVCRLESGLTLAATALNLVSDLGRKKAVKACRHCARCSAACPLELPIHLWAGHDYAAWPGLKKGDALLNCLDCGLCSLVCPAQRPLRELTIKLDTENY